jgi:CRP-like cAMP-binding protein
VELAVAAPSGRDAICGLLNEGAFLGEEVLAGSVARPCSATALIPTEVLAVTKTDMLRLLGTQQAFAERFIAHSVGRTARLEADLTDQLLYPCENRLARVLLTLAEYDEQRPLRCPLPDVSQEFIARMVGTTRSRVNQFLGKFKKLGYVEDHGGVLQINPALLIRYCTRMAN